MNSLTNKQDEYKTVYKYTDENWTCEIKEYQAGLGNGKFSTNYLAIFEDKISGGSICQHYNTIPCCGKLFIERLEHHYEVVCPKYNLDNDNFATRQLEAEDNIDTKLMEDEV